MTMHSMADHGPLKEDRLMRVAEVARVFDVETRTVGTWLRAGRLKSVRTPGGHRRIRESAVLALLAEQEAAE